MKKEKGNDLIKRGVVLDSLLNRIIKKLWYKVTPDNNFSEIIELSKDEEE